MGRVAKIGELIDKMTPDVLGKLVVPETTRIFQKEWFLGVAFEEKDENLVDLWRERNKDNYTCRFVPRNTKTCYLAKDMFRIEDEMRFPRTIKKVNIKGQIKLLNFDLNCVVSSNHTKLMKETYIYDEVKLLIMGPRSPKNYEDSCILADYIFKKDFDGVYYSPHPDAKNGENTLIKQVNAEAQKISPYFDFNSTCGPRLDPMLVIFKNQKTEKVIEFFSNNYV